MLKSDNRLEFTTKFYEPTTEEAVLDFMHLYEKLKNGVYGDGEDPQQDADDWDEDFMFLLRVYYRCIFENFDREQKEKLWNFFVQLVIKRCELQKGLK